VRPADLVWLSAGGEPPVTIIEIPSPPPPETVPTTAPAVTPATSSTITQQPPPPSEAVESPGGLGSIIDLAIWLALLVVLIALGLGLWRQRRSGREQVGAETTVDPHEALSAVSSRGFEAIAYRTGGVLSGSAVRAESLSTHPTLEEAIAAARSARLAFQPEEANLDAWWVVWNLGTQRAAWIAEWATPGESVIDLRSGRREPYLAGDQQPRR